MTDMITTFKPVKPSFRGAETHLIGSFKAFAWPAPSHRGFQDYQALSMLSDQEVKFLLAPYECDLPLFGLLQHKGSQCKQHR